MTSAGTLTGRVPRLPETQGSRPGHPPGPARVVVLLLTEPRVRRASRRYADSLRRMVDARKGISASSCAKS